jgi:hypothetical protein
VTTPAVRAAVYALFATRWIVHWAIGAVFALMGLFVVYHAGVWAYYAQPWYNQDVIRQLGSGPRTAPWGDVSDRAVELFPDGMSGDVAITLLRRNGFSCNTAVEASSDEGFICHRKAYTLVCNTDYDVELLLDQNRNVVGRKAKFYGACM